MGSLTNEVLARHRAAEIIHPSFRLYPVGTQFRFTFSLENDGIVFLGEVLAWDTSKKVPERLRIKFRNPLVETPHDNCAVWYSKDSINIVGDVEDTTKKYPLINREEHPIGTKVRVRITHQNLPPVEDVVLVDEWVFTVIGGKPVYDNVVLRAILPDDPVAVMDEIESSLYLPTSDVEVLEVMEYKQEPEQDPRDHRNFKEWPPSAPTTDRTVHGDLLYHIAQIKRIAKEKGLTASITFT